MTPSPTLRVQQAAHKLAQEFVIEGTLPDAFFRFKHDELSVLRNGMLVIVTVRLLHETEEGQGLVNGKKLVEVIKGDKP